ncbi:MAG: hypothetical protein ACU88J_15150 [Gammaproteobacteria bacterium]
MSIKRSGNMLVSQGRFDAYLNLLRGSSFRNAGPERCLQAFCK